MVFFKEFLKNRKEVGSVIPSSRKLARVMSSQVDYDKANVIVELGAGLGTFTDEIVKRLKPDTKLIIVEINEKFFNILRDKFKNKENIFIVKDSAENLDEILLNYGYGKADYVISGLPFLNFPKGLRKGIFEVVSSCIEHNFILFQYTRILEKELLEHYNIVKRKKVIFNIPPANVYVFEKKF